MCRRSLCTLAKLTQRETEEACARARCKIQIFYSPLVANVTAVLQLIRIVLEQMIAQTPLAAEGALALGTRILQHLTNLCDFVVHRFYVCGQIVL